MGKKKIWSTSSNSYTELKTIGQGGNGYVFQVVDKTGKSFALKQLLKPERKAYQRFKDEIHILSHLKDQEGIIAITDSYFPDNPTNQDLPFYVMPLAQTLENYLATQPHEKIFDIIISLAETLQRLHDAGITHRDIKPANMLVLGDKPVLSDFGLANFPAKTPISSPTEAIGARWTIAPEMQREKDPADFNKADIYALAKSLWMLITKKQLSFEGQYVANSPISIRNFVEVKINITTLAGNWYYFSIVLLEKLLTESTSNDPSQRPVASEFAAKLRFWYKSNEDFYQRNFYEWEDALQQIFPVSIPMQAQWDNTEDILRVLRILTNYDNLNYMFYPDRGGMDMDNVSLFDGQSCLRLNDDIIIKPKRLLFEMAGDMGWSYFRLELDNIEFLNEEGADREDIVLTEKGELISEDEFEEGGRFGIRVSRFRKGCFTITFKMSPINQLRGQSDAYNGSHSKLSATQYRDRILAIRKAYEEPTNAK